MDTWTIVLFNLCVGRCFSGYLSYSVLLKELNFLRNSLCHHSLNYSEVFAVDLENLSQDGRYSIVINYCVIAASLMTLTELLRLAIIQCSCFLFHVIHACYALTLLYKISAFQNFLLLCYGWIVLPFTEFLQNNLVVLV